MTGRTWTGTKAVVGNKCQGCSKISIAHSPTQGKLVQVNMHKGMGCEAVAYTYSAKDKLDGQQEKQEHSSNVSMKIA